MPLLFFSHPVFLSFSLFFPTWTTILLVWRCRRSWEDEEEKEEEAHVGYSFLPAEDIVILASV